METERREFELWRECNWRCEWWSVGGRPQVRLYLGTHQVGELTAGPHLDLQRQTDEWLAAARADGFARRAAHREPLRLMSPDPVSG